MMPWDGGSPAIPLAQSLNCPMGGHYHSTLWIKQLRPRLNSATCPVTHRLHREESSCNLLSLSPGKALKDQAFPRN